MSVKTIMFALLAAVTFLIALLGGEVGTVNLTLLGLAFLSIHFLWGWPFTTNRFTRRE